MKRLIGLVVGALCTVAVGGVATAGAVPAAAGDWSVVTLPLPADAASNPQIHLGVGACGSPGQCFVPGSYVSTGHGTQGLLVTVSGGVPTAQSLPAPPAAPADPREFFDKVACRSTGACVAVGNYELSTGPYAGVLASQNASGWHVIDAPRPAGTADAQVRLYDVACGGPTCFAVGSIDPGSGPLVEQYANGRWTPSVLAPPAGQTGGFNLERISCSSQRRCVAAGTSYSNGQYGPLIGATWDGTSWTTSLLAPPADAIRRSTHNDPEASACAPGGACHVFAPYPPRDKTAQYRPADYANDGTTWTTTGLPNADPPSTGRTGIYSATCRSKTSCFAVGYGSGGGPFRGVVATLSASGWSVVYAPAAPGATAGPGVLKALNCLPSGECTAFGGGPSAVTVTGTMSTTLLPTPTGPVYSTDITTALYDGTRQLALGSYSTNNAYLGALWMRAI